MSIRPLPEVFANALQSDLLPDRPSITTVAHAGNWKALYPTLQGQFSNLELSYGSRYPVVFAEGIAFYLKQNGLAGALQFKATARRMLRKDARLFIFDAQRVECLRSNPSCILDVVVPGRVATLFFREAVDPAISSYLAAEKTCFEWRTTSVCPSSVSVVATKLAAGIVRDEYKHVVGIVTPSECEALETMRKELSDVVGPEVEDLFLEGSFGAEKLRTFARRRIAVSLLKTTTPSYSLRSNRDPVAFFREELSEKFIRHQLPVASVNEVSPNLSFVVKSQKRFSELRLG